MSLWLMLGAMTAVAVALAVWPLVRRPGALSARRDHDLRVYRAQLEELARERDRGLLDEREAEAARLELERRMLAADARPREWGGGTPAAPAGWRVAAVVVIVLPALAAGLYWRLGSPEQPAAPFASRAEERRQLATAEEDSRLPSVETMIARLEARLADHPDDVEGWFRLGQAYALTQQYERAAGAYRRAIAVQDDAAELHAALGEALVMLAGGTIGPEASAAFTRALALDAGDPRARFYAGLALLQGGDRRGALDAWVALLGDTPADAPWQAGLRERAVELAQELGLDPEEVVPAPQAVAAAPPPASEADARAEVAELEARLAAEPKDYQGWIRVAQLWARLGEPARARDALSRGADAYPGAPFVQQQLQTAAAELGLDQAGNGSPGPSAEQRAAAQEMAPEDREQMIRGMVDGLAARLEAEPDDVEGWRMLGRSWQVLGEPERSAEAYAKVASLLPEDVAAQVDLAQALLLLEDSTQAPSPEAATQLSKVLELDQNNPEALYHLGRAAAAQGDATTAARYWQRLLAQLPPDAPERAEVQSLLDGLGGND